MKHRRDPFQSNHGFAHEASKADQHAAAGNYDLAISKFRSLLRNHPNDLKLMDALGRCLLATGQLRDAEKNLRKVVARKPDDLRAVLNLVTTLALQSKFRDARRTVNAALQRQPNHPRLLTRKVNLLLTEGHFDDALAVLEPAIEQHPTNINLAMSYSVVAQSTDRTAEAITALQRALDQPDVDHSRRITALCALGRLYDARGEYEQAFETFMKASAEKNPQFDPAAFDAAVDEIIRRWTPDAIAALPKVAAKESDRCIFIVGMPRSGTTLIEQILDAHPEVRGLGELTLVERFIKSWMHGFNTAGVPLLTDPDVLQHDMLERGRQAYLRSTVQEHGRGLHVIDKMPLNFMHLGVIAAMLPAARVIHCRRNPIDTCLSCFTHDFAGASFVFTYDLEHLGRMYRSYQRLMEHWQSVLDLTITEVVYEELVADQSRISRGLVESLGLPWDERCLRFHESARIAFTSSRDQVRKPIFTSSVDRSKRYGSLLQPLIDALELTLDD